MQITRRQFLCAASAAATMPIIANAETPVVWPTKVVTIVTPYAPGGGTDVVARLLAARLAQKLKQPFIVDNRAGATGNIGTGYVTKSAPDGNTLMIGIVSNFAINQHLFRKMPYKPEDLATVTIAVEYPNALVVGPQSPFHNMKELVAYARANPGKLNYASAGIGSTGHLAIEMLSQLEGIKMTNIIYKGSGPSLVALLGGEVDLVMDAMPVYVQQVKSGKLHALAVTTANRSPLLPDVPTMQEAGMKDFVVPVWFGIGAPANTPPALLRKINEEFHAVLVEPTIVEALAKNGYTARGDSIEASQRFVAAESEKYAKFIRSANISID